MMATVQTTTGHFVEVGKSLRGDRSTESWTNVVGKDESKPIVECVVSSRKDESNIEISHWQTSAETDP